MQIPEHLSRGRIKWFRWVFILMILCLFWGGNSFFRSDTVERLERYIYDVYSGRASDASITPEIVIILAGEESIARLGRWPWTRDRHAQLMTKLKAAHTVIFDILFPETSTAREDDLLIEAASEIDKLVLAVHYFDAPDTAFPVLKRPFPELASLATAIGFTNMSIDIDGFVRYTQPYIQVQTTVTPSLPLASAATITGRPLKNAIQVTDIESFLSTNQIATDEHNRIWHTFSSTEFPKYEYVNVLNGEVPPDELAGKAVFVGVAASGAEDFFTINLQGARKEISGAELNAHMVKALLSGNGPYRATAATDSLITIFFVLCGAAISLARSPLVSFGGLVVIVLISHILHAFLFLEQNLWIAQALPLLGIVTTFFSLHFFQYKVLHHEAEVKSLSISHINALPKLLNLDHKSHETYLTSIWQEIEKNHKIFLIHPKSSLHSQQHILPQEVTEISEYEPNKAVILKQAQGTFHYLALIPLHRESTLDTQEFTILGWHEQFSDAEIEAVIAVVLSSSWYFDMIRQAQARKNMLLDTIHAIAAAVDAKDPVTGGHSHRVSEVTREITAHLRLDPQTQEDIFLGALIHDIGKIGVPDTILSKPGKLTEDEFHRIKDHPAIGHKIMRSVALPDQTVQGIHQHHERYDGNGYPNQISGESISLAGRIIAVADVFDALLSDRPYREGMPLEKVCAFMEKNKGVVFDEQIVNALLAIKTPRNQPEHP